ncbi:hypothetical protein, partial [Bifidobacterium mongoliense]|uniref:hypothetical protein n=1 Tax=Bifidobacterium mongoliense TaxID=518643 RepID=UPI001ED99D7B
LRLISRLSSTRYGPRMAADRPDRGAVATWIWMTCLSSSPICEYTRDMGATPSSRGNLDNLQWYKVLHFNLDNGASPFLALRAIIERGDGARLNLTIRTAHMLIAPAM